MNQPRGSKKKSTLLKIGVTSLKMIKNCKFVDKVSRNKAGNLNIVRRFWGVPINNLAI